MRKSIQELVREFKPKRRPRRLLEVHHQELIELRSKGASYEAMQKLLAEGGLLVPKDAIMRFCRKYQAEIEREEAKAINQAEPTAITQTRPVTTVPPKVVTAQPTGSVHEIAPSPSTRPPQKDGPRIAYDKF